MRHKLGVIGFSYLAGLICAALLGAWHMLIAAGALLIVCVILFILKRKAAAVAVFTALAAVCVYGIFTALVYEPVISMAGETVEINGRVSEIRYYSNDTAAYVVDAKINGVNTSLSVFSSDTECAVGDLIKFTGKLSEPIDNTNFAEKSYYKAKGIFLNASPVSAPEITPDDTFNLRSEIISYSNFVGDKISLFLPGDEGTLLKAMFLGDRSDLSDELSSNIKRAGISHFTSVSGLHLTVTANVLMLLLSLTPLKRHRIFKFISLTALILTFMIFFKMSASVIRAGIMLIVYYGAEPFMRKGSTINSMGLAVLAITLFQPYACLDMGLLLSLAGTFGAGVVSPHIVKCFRKTRFYAVKSSLSASFCATLCTFPLSCVFFGGFSIVGIIVNFLLYPLFLPALICAALFAATGCVSGGLLFAAGMCSKVMLLIIDLFGNFKYSYIALDYNFVEAILVLSAIFVIVIYICFKDARRTAMAVALSICVLFGGAAAENIYNYGKTKLILYSDGDDVCVIAENGSEIFVAASDDSRDIYNYINEYMRNNYIDELSVMKLFGSTHNNISAFEKISCQRLSPPDDFDVKYSAGGKISIDCREKYGTVFIDGISVCVSPAGDPVEGGISVLYGYKKEIPSLGGLVYCSSRRVNTDLADRDNFTNLYYNETKLIIDENGFVMKYS